MPPVRDAEHICVLSRKPDLRKNVALVCLVKHKMRAFVGGVNRSGAPGQDWDQFTDLPVETGNPDRSGGNFAEAESVLTGWKVSTGGGEGEWDV